MEILRRFSVTLESDVIEYAWKGRRRIDRIGHFVLGEIRMQGIIEPLIGERETSVVVAKGRINQKFRIRTEIREGLVLVKMIVEYLHHDIRACEVGEPISEDVLRQQPSPEPCLLDVVSKYLPDGLLLGWLKLLRPKSIIRGCQCTPGHP